MEWSLCTNDMFRDEITKITNSLIPVGFEGDVRSIRLMQESVARLVDRLGAQSAAAQGLSKVITTADKLRTADDHTLYLYKDANAENGAGAVVGLLKVGRKHLFLADAAGRVHEVEPLCVLDFFVVPAYQRAGVGKALFDHMLQEQGMQTHRLAIDGPSENMTAFLRRKYGVPHLLRQNNNFAVAPNFFDDLAPGTSNSGLITPAATTVGRYSAAKPHSSIANVIHGGGERGDHDGHYQPPNNSLNAAHGTDWRPSIRRHTSPPRACEASVAASTPASRPPSAAGSAGQGSSPPRPCTLPVSAAPPPAPVAPAGLATPTPGGAPHRRNSQHTDKGFFDVKFYHKKLW